MATIDSSIALQARPIELPDQLQQYARIQQIQGLQNQNSIQQLAMQDKQRSYDDQESLTNAIRNNMDPTTGKQDTEGVIRSLAKSGSGHLIQQFQNGVLSNEKTEAGIGESKAKANKDNQDAAKQHLDTLKVANGMMGAAAGALMQNPTQEHAQALISELQSKLGPELSKQLQLDTVQIPTDPVAIKDWATQHYQGSIDADKQLTDTRAKLEGDANRKNAVLTTGMTNATTRRGQDITAATAAAGQNAPVYDPERGVVVNKRGATAVPVLQGGQPLTSGKPLTESQGNATALGMRAIQAQETIKNLDNGGFDSLNLKDRMAAGTPFDLTRGAMSGQAQQYENAQRNFISAVLRKESGAAISNSEFDNERKKYFPQVGDGADVKAQKEQLRTLAIEGLKAEAGQQGSATMENAHIVRAAPKAGTPIATQGNGVSPAAGVPAGWSVEVH